MAWLTTRFYSEQLGLNTSAEVLLPQPATSGQVGMSGPQARDRYPALYLLHGWSDDESIWMRRTSIERYASEHSLAIIMPRVDLSYYQDTHSGMNYWSFLSEELPTLCEGWFPISTDRADRFAGGLSMGGYGAFRLGLLRPDRFSAAISLSGALDLEGLRDFWRDDPKRMKILRGVFGEELPIEASDRDLLHLARAFKSAGSRFYQWCGTEDFLYPANQNFRATAEAAGLPLVYREGPGDHSWPHWDREIQPALGWLMEDPAI